MSNGEEKLKLTDLIDIDFLQKLQDTFAKAIGVASLTIDDKGPITQRSNFSEFCTNFIRSCEMGSSRCNESDIQGGKMALEAGEPVIYGCHAGLGHFAVPIIVDNQHIATILGGQFAFKKPDEKHFKNLAKELRIPNEREYIKALRKIKIHSREHIQFAADLLFLVSNAISEIARKNLELKEINKKEHFYREIIDAIRSSLDINETLFLICEATARFFNVQRASVSEAPPTWEIKRPTVRMEYKTIPDMEGLGKLIHFDEIAEYYFKIVEKGEVLAVDNFLESDTPDFFKESYIALGVKSLLAIPIQKEEKWGILILSEYNDYRYWSDDEIEIAKSIASQIYIAIKHAEAYEQEKKTARRENILRRLIETIRSSLDINEIKNIMVEEICKVLDANRCFIIEYDKETDKFLPVKNEYLASADVKSAIGFDLRKEVKHLEDMNREGKEVILPDVETFLKENNLYNTPAEKHFREYGVKSGFSMPIAYQDELLGILVIHNTIQTKAFDYEEVELIRTLSNQIAIAIHQAKLYDQEKKTSAKEVTLRETIKIIRSTLDSEKIRNYFLDVACTYFGADRCIFDEYNKETKEFLPFRIERLKSDDVKSLIGVSVEGGFPEFADKLRNKKRNIIIKDVEKTLARKKLPNYKAIQTLYKSDAKSDYGFVVQYQNEILGILILHYVKNKKVFTTEELEFLKILRDQAGIALHQAELYEKSKSQAKKEALLRRITERIRSSLDIDEILGIIAHKTANLFGVDRIAITEFPDIDNLRNLRIRKEYKAFEDIKSPFEVGNYIDVGEFIANYIINSGKPLIIDNIQESDFEEMVINFYKSLEAKSLVWVPIMSKKNELWGFIILSTISKYKSWSQEDISFLSSISNQIYIAINQAELFETAQTKAKNENALREIMLSSVSSFDMKDIIRSIVAEAGKLFKADRCFYVEVNAETMSEFPICGYAEYLSSDDIVSHTTKQPGSEEIDVFVNQGNNLASYVMYSNNVYEEDLPESTKKMFAELSVKSYLHSQVAYGEKIYGAIVFHYVKDFKQFTQEDVDMALAIANQSAIVLHQAELYEKEKTIAKRESLLKRITERIRSSLNIEETLSFICEETAKLFNVQRTAITSFPHPNSYETFIVRKEYKHWPDMEGFGFREHSAKAAAYWAEVLIEGEKVLTIDNVDQSDTPDYFKNTYSTMGVKALIGTAIRKGDNVWGTLVLAEYNNYRYWSEDEKNLLKTIADQVYIAINQAELFEKSQKKAENERILREIMLTSVQTFDMKTMIKSLVTDAGKLFEADRCFFIEVDNETNTNLPVQEYAEYRSSEDIVSHTTRPPSKNETSNFIQRTKEKRYEYSVDVSKEAIPEAAKKMLIEDLSVKSYLIAPVYYGDICYGAFVFHYVKNYRQFSEDDVQMAIAVANQSAVILHQAELFELTKIQAEREKISKNIIEILRSTLDRGIIKRLFVKNIGQFLNADRVIFSEFNPEIGNYNPVGVDSEYLSEPDIKSFVGYDWSCDEAQEFIQPILERRELHIYNWSEYIQGNYKGQDFINLFESMDIKSSYSFPVMYQQRVMGFFSIGFVKRVRRLSDEDINRVRSICTQAGIALYHAHLYEEAQKSVQDHDKFVNKLSTELNEPLSLIVDFSSIKSRHELECAEEVEHLNTINTNAKKLLYLLEDITKCMKKLNLE